MLVLKVVRNKSVDMGVESRKQPILLVRIRGEKLDFWREFLVSDCGSF